MRRRTIASLIAVTLFSSTSALASTLAAYELMVTSNSGHRRTLTLERTTTGYRLERKIVLDEAHVKLNKGAISVLESSPAPKTKLRSCREGQFTYLRTVSGRAGTPERGCLKDVRFIQLRTAFKVLGVR